MEEGVGGDVILGFIGMIGLSLFLWSWVGPVGIQILMVICFLGLITESFRGK